MNRQHDIVFRPRGLDAVDLGRLTKSLAGEGLADALNVGSF